MFRWIVTAALAGLFLTACQEVPVEAESPAINGNGASDALTAKAIEAHMTFLADDLLEGRRPGTPGYDVAANYVASQFQQLGLAPAGDDGGYFQNVVLRQTRTVDGTAGLAFIRNGAARNIDDPDSFIVFGNPSSPRTEVSAPVVFAGFGVTAPELGHDDYAGLDVTGRIVAVLNNAPSRFPGDQRAFYSSTRGKLDTAAALGAIGVIVIHGPADEIKQPWQRVLEARERPSMRWLDASGEPQGIAPEILGAAMINTDVAALLFVDAPTGLEEIFETAVEGAPRGFALDVTARIEGESLHNETLSPNVIARLQGSDPELADEYVVFSAHLDHLGVADSGDGDRIYNGAYDNASGTAFMLEVARSLVSNGDRPRRSILFVGTTAEESGLLGADRFASNPTVPVDAIVANINLDMLHMTHPLHDIIAFGAEHSSLGGNVETAASALGLEVSPDPFPDLSVFIRADHYSFVRQGIPAISLFPGFVTGDPNVDGAKLFGDWMAKNYHKPSDDMTQTFDYEVGVTFVKLYALIGLDIANADDRPTWNAGDFFGEKFGPDRMAPQTEGAGGS